MMMRMRMMVVFWALLAGDAFTEYHTTAACVFPLLRPRQFPGQQAYPQDEHAVESLGSLCWDWTVVMWGTPWYTDWAACHRCKEIPHRPELPIPSMSVKQMLGAQRCSNFLKFWKHCGFLRWYPKHFAFFRGCDFVVSTKHDFICCLLRGLDHSLMAQESYRRES